MRLDLLEIEGKEMLQRYGINIPQGFVIMDPQENVLLKFPFMLKVQVPLGNRKLLGGITKIDNQQEYSKKVSELFQRSYQGHRPERLLAEEFICAQRELYVSFSYSKSTAVLALSSKGGTGIQEADVYEIDILEGCTKDFIVKRLRQSGFEENPDLIRTIEALWMLFSQEQLLLAEINPLFETESGYVAGDAKIRRDPNLTRTEKMILPLDGNIAVLASGGGASMYAIDQLMSMGGRPANYVEYSGNPPSEIVEHLTMQLLSMKNLRGCWVVGGIANFTDLYETLSGFMQGLIKTSPKVTYPIVIRRDGPRKDEAFTMIQTHAKEHGFDITIFDSSTSISQSAQFLVNSLETKNYEYSPEKG